ncbi:Pyridoxine/pyridoxamine 5'-phosphate oxidase [Thalassocella blandensis]|nr:Pyridoxine/pyridoxamine 5'-phosphate oxidase [Thalassocella blandensis]
MLELEEIRREYLLGGLQREGLSGDPITQFELWLEQAIASQIPDPTAMTLATVSADGQPSQRIVLLKHVDARGFVFYTNYESAKAQDIAANSKVSLHFPWHAMERQVKVMGRAEKIPVAESLKYFLTRPRDSQIAAWASSQSRAIDSRKFLMSQFEAIKEKFQDGDVPLPDFWGGFRIEPHVVEFWQGGGKRLHDRFEYRRVDHAQENLSHANTGDAEWLINRLAP